MGHDLAKLAKLSCGHKRRIFQQTSSKTYYCFSCDSNGHEIVETYSRFGEHDAKKYQKKYTKTRGEDNE